MLADLHQAASTGDAAALGRLAHTLQSSAGNLGARRLQRLCAEAEALTRTGPEAWERPLSATVDGLTAELERVMTALRAERQRSAAA
jgi:HPt (histidine-containing phosphotransfer) domain-containing protein